MIIHIWFLLAVVISSDLGMRALYKYDPPYGEEWIAFMIVSIAIIGSSICLFAFLNWFFTANTFVW